MIQPTFDAVAQRGYSLGAGLASFSRATLNRSTLLEFGDAGLLEGRGADSIGEIRSLVTASDGFTIGLCRFGWGTGGDAHLLESVLRIFVRIPVTKEAARLRDVDGLRRGSGQRSTRSILGGGEIRIYCAAVQFASFRARCSNDRSGRQEVRFP